MNSSKSFQFDNYRLADSLVDLEIPVINSANSTRTDKFSSYEAKKETRKNYTMYDVVMAATAAQTYFPAHRIENELYEDGNLIHILN